MVRAERFLTYCQRASDEGFRLCVLLLPAIEGAQADEAISERGMIRPECFLTNRQSSQEERFGLLSLTLRAIERAEMFEDLSYIRMFRAKRLFANL